MNDHARILVVDDEPSMLQYLRTVLEAGSYQVETVQTGSEALLRVQKEPAPDVVLLDVLIPDLDGLKTLEMLKKARPHIKVVMLSCTTDPRKVVQAIRLGAVDYLTKPFQLDDLEAVLQHSLTLEAAPLETSEVETKIEELGDDLCFIGASSAMRKIRAQVEQMAAVNVPVLILGESGTGKEIVARLIHQISPRASRTFLKVNCAALPADLLESELFGYEVGAFTGASRAKPGKFELSDKGTIFLDEIAEMPPTLQAKLLHVLQDGEFMRLGGQHRIKVDVRVLAATNIDVHHALETKMLREDLYYRLSGFIINLPPLRERPEDILLLVQHYVTRFAADYGLPAVRLTPEFQDMCLRYVWPGNVRELENVAKRLVILGHEE